MDHELKNLVLNINQLAALSGLHRQTVVARLKNIRPAGGCGLQPCVDFLRGLSPRN